MTLEQFFSKHPKAALAFSGGVDSAYLLWAGLQAGAEVWPYFVKTPFQPRFELEDARALAGGLGAELRVLEVDILALPEVAANPPERCYFCKKGMFSAIARAAGEEPVTGIYTYEDLLALAEAPSGRYRLMDNIDMAGRAWTPVDFSGELDGNGYALLNLEVETLGAGTATTYDGNYKTYDTHFAGLFGTLTDARVFNLELCNVKVKVEADTPCFIGSIAGYSEHSLIEGCRVTGILELSAHDRMFGVGGIVGYGSGSMRPEAAQAFLDYLTTADAGAVFESVGFTPMN